jgi:hypothetical protein
MNLLESKALPSKGGLVKKMSDDGLSPQPIITIVA